MEEFQKTLLTFIKAQQEQTAKQQEFVIKSQQEFLSQLTSSFGSANPKTVTKVGEEFRMESLGYSITEFYGDPESGLTFEIKHKIYENVFLEDDKELSDYAKVRLLLRKLETPCHEQYINLILPKNTKDLNFVESIGKILQMFGKATSTFYTKYQCTQLTKHDSEDFIAL
ncbi:unnamed protein product [Psylliodes chrysocephalus]|uniref:DUF7083 domain-containing protein n=1 Tax=Psylliodes chrysocephalus TaxID=3402493 RepID=A0A9P0GHL4_9CUCU|nr:unnamed protein product [Psylliodes chrysocephala]